MIVVEVLITSCHVSLKPKNGPLIAQATTTATAMRKVAGLPARCEVRVAKWENMAEAPLPLLDGPVVALASPALPTTVGDFGAEAAFW